MTSAAIAAASICLSVSPSLARTGMDDIPLPAVLTHPLQPQQLVQMVDVPSVNIDAVLKEDLAAEAEGQPPRYAIPNAVKLTTRDAGTWEPLDDFNSVWRLRVHSRGAISLNFGFTEYQMPEGGRLYIYSSDMRMVIRAFTAADNAPHGELWTPPVVGEEAVIEVVVPNEARRELKLTLGSINVGYREFAIPSQFKSDDGGLASGSCNIDVVCPEGIPWQDEIKAVGVISTGGSTFCTGFMVNNTAQDRKPYFMTANHCGVNSGNAASLVVFWNYENSTCRPIGSPASGGPGDGNLNTFQTGSFFRAAYAPSDFTLVELDENPNSAWGVTFAGWDRTPGDYNPPNGAGIHHPNTDEKRISFWGGPTAQHPSHNSSWGCSPWPGTGSDNTHIKVYWTPGLGVTEPGSSGSPLFDNNHHVIGQLHGGASACGQTGENLSDCYGRFSVSWTGGGTSATRLSNWLDTGNTGATTLNTMGRGLSLTPSGPVTHVGVVGGPFVPASTNYTLSNTTSLPANYSISIVAGGTAPITLNGGAGPLSGSISASSSFNFTVAPAASATSLAAGIYSTSVLVQDTTNNLSYTQVHTIEVGQIGYTTTPANGLTSGGPVGGPFSGTQVYALTSTRPTPVTVVVTASAPWISINGGSGPVNINLPTTGSTGNVTIGYSAAANSLPAGIVNGSVTFNAQSGGTGSNTTRPVTLDVGRYTYAYTGPPLPITDFNTTTSTLTVTDNYCVGDVDLPIDITHTYIGDLVIEIRSPAGTVVRLHNRTGGGTDNLVTTYDDEPGTGVTAPDGPGTLSLFDGENVQGVWTLTVADQAGADVGTLNAWSLKIASQSNCQQRVVVHDFPMNTDPGWTPQGQWAFGVPAGVGVGGHPPDPSSGATGTNVYGFNLNGEYTNLMPVYYLTTTALNMSGKTGSQLKFKRWLGIESSAYDHASVQVSNNGTTWTTVWNHVGGTFNDAAWVQQTIDISAVADNQATVFIRWGMGTTDGSVTYCGWNIDDVQVLAFAPACAGDTNASGTVDVNDLLAVITTWGACPGCPPAHCPADMAPAPNGDCQIDVNDLLAVVTHWGACP